MTPERFRERVPIFERKVFLNSCSKGALSTGVEEAYRRYLDSWKSLGSPWEEWVSVLERTRARFAAFCGASEDEIAVTFCASTAIGSLATSLDFQSGRNRVLLGDFEFPTMAHNWLVHQRRGARMVRIRASGERLPYESYRDAIDERTLLVPVAHVSFRNGYRQDVRKIASAARDAGAFSLVDDYQSTGTRPLDVKELGCDFLVTGALNTSWDPPVSLSSTSAGSSSKRSSRFSPDGSVRSVHSTSTSSGRAIIRVRAGSRPERRRYRISMPGSPGSPGSACWGK